jgi:hypothetical protein
MCILPHHHRGNPAHWPKLRIEQYVERNVARSFDEVSGKAGPKSPTELATRCAVPAKSLAMSSIFGTWDSPHPPATIVMRYRTPIHRAYCCAVPAFIAPLVMPCGTFALGRQFLKNANAPQRQC